jgi:hypothetical protein
MMVVLGAKQRSRSEFERLLKQADPRYEVSDPLYLIHFCFFIVCLPNNS